MKKNILFIILLLLSIPYVSSTEEYLSLEWKYDATASASHVDFLTLDKEGTQAVVSGVSLYTTAGVAGWLTAVEADGDPLWQKKGFLAFSSMRVTDIDKDGKDEIIAGVSHYVHCFDTDGNVKWKVATGAKNVITSIELADINKDGYDEVIAAGESMHLPNIYVIGKTGKIIWNARAQEGVNSIAVGDIDGDGKLNVVSGTVGRHGVFYKSSFIRVFDNNGKTVWDKRIDKGTAKIALGDVTGDGKLEILLGSLHNLWVFDYQSNKIFSYETKGYIRDIIVADIDLDGRNEVILGSNDLYVLDSKGKLKWTNSAGKEAINDMELMDIDSDGYPEILIGSDGAYIVDHNGDMVWEYATEKAVKSVAVGDLNGDTFIEVVAGSLDNFIYLFTSNRYKLTTEAEKYHSAAKNNYASGNTEAAIENARKAKDYFIQLNASDRVSDMDQLITLIKSTATQAEDDENLAYTYYNKSRSFYITGEYMNASYWARKASYKYEEIDNESMKNKSDELIANSQKYLKQKADEYFEKASSNLRSSNYDLALENSKNASKIVIWLENRNKTITILELTADIYTQMAEEQRSSGEFEKASSSIQNALFIYKCIDGAHPTYPPECFPSDIEPKDISILIEEIGNISYNDSVYMNESIHLRSIVYLISENNTGDLIGDFGDIFSIFNPISDFFGYLANLISWNFTVIMIIVALIIIILLLYVLLSVIQGKKLQIPTIKEIRNPLPIISSILSGIRKPKTKTIKPDYRSYYKPDTEPVKVEKKVEENELEVEKIRKDGTRSVGVTLTSLQKLGDEK